MILRNYYKILDAILQGTDTDNLTVFTKTDGGKMNARYYSSSDSSYIDALGFHDLTRLRDSLTYQGVVFGDGATEPSFDDYTLAGSVIKGLTGTISRTGTNNGESGAEATAVITVTNGNSNEVTIREVGYIGYATFYYTNSSNSTGGYIMLDRTVLDTPVTIPAGGVGQVTYTIRMNYPTA